MKPTDRSGFSLVELMIALAIGSFLVVGAVVVHSIGRTTYAHNESLARLQENARYVLSALAPDIERAGYYGFTNAPETLRLVVGANPSITLATASAMRQRPLPPAAPEPVPAAGAPSGAHACGINFAVDVLMPVQGADNGYALGPGATSACEPYGSGAAEGADTLTIRRAATLASEPEPGTLQLYASRLSSRSVQHLYVDGTPPGPVDADHEVRDLIVRAWYVAQDSVERPGHPALRVKSLTNVAGTAAFIDTEVMPGVEDLQVQFGIDTGDLDGDGVIDPGADSDGDGIPVSSGRATRYVDPDFPGLERFQVVAVRVWVRLRGERPEPGYHDGRTYEYANIRYEPVGEAASYRRLLVWRTITLRNARTL